MDTDSIQPRKNTENATRWGEATDEPKPFYRKEADTSALEREIDELVYALYGLTPEEKALVQAAAK